MVMLDCILGSLGNILVMLMDNLVILGCTLVMIHLYKQGMLGNMLVSLGHRLVSLGNKLVMLGNKMVMPLNMEMPFQNIQEMLHYIQATLDYISEKQDPILEKKDSLDALEMKNLHSLHKTHNLQQVMKDVPVLDSIYLNMEMQAYHFLLKYPRFYLLVFQLRLLAFLRLIRDQMILFQAEVNLLT